jgi:hypothetical protein
MQAPTAQIKVTAVDVIRNEGNQGPTDAAFGKLVTSVITDPARRKSATAPAKSLVLIVW